MCPWFDSWRYHKKFSVINLIFKQLRIFCFEIISMNHFLYIIYSKSTDKYYVGETHSIEERMEKHKNHVYQNSFTKIANDWELVLVFDCGTREKALFLENFIKRLKSKVFIKKIISQTTILEDILTKHQ